MERYAAFLLKYKKTVLFFFFAASAVCVLLAGMTGVNYNFADYLPESAPSTKALRVMEEEYSQAVPNMRVMVQDVAIPEALEIKRSLAAVEGVEAVSWLDDVVELYAPLEMADEKTVKEWYVDGNACFSLTVSEQKEAQAVAGVRELIGEEGYMSGAAVESAVAPVNTARDVQNIMLLVVPIILLILILTTQSWFEPVLFLITIGAAIVLNMGTNLVFGTVSFVTNAAGPVLQMAVSMDYSIFLLHQFARNREQGMKEERAMMAAVKQSVGSVLSSGLTTVTGFLALTFMQFRIGPDLGWAMAKAILISLVCTLCFLPALAVCCSRLIDRTRHRPFLPRFDGFAGLVMKVRVPVLILTALAVPVLFLAQQNNRFYYGGSEVYSSLKTQMGRDAAAIHGDFGSSDPVVLMVPKGEPEKEAAMNEELKSLEGVAEVLSYVGTVGSSIPAEYVPEQIRTQFYSPHYSRFVVTLHTRERESDWYEKVNGVRSVGEKYYGKELLYAGELVSTEDLKSTITQDNLKVNFLAILLVFLILLVNFRSFILPLILTLVIESSIWINLGIPYFMGTPLFYIGYLIVSTVQLGATIDYAILFTDRYMQYRKRMEKKEAARETLKSCTLSILTSALVLTLAGTVLGRLSTNGVISQLGSLIGRGAVLSFVLVVCVLPTLLILLDGAVKRTTWQADFYEKISPGTSGKGKAAAVRLPGKERRRP